MFKRAVLILDSVLVLLTIILASLMLLSFLAVTNFTYNWFLGALSIVPWLIVSVALWALAKGSAVEHLRLTSQAKVIESLRMRVRLNNNSDNQSKWPAFILYLRPFAIGLRVSDLVTIVLVAFSVLSLLMIISLGDLVLDAREAESIHHSLPLVSFFVLLSFTVFIFFILPDLARRMGRIGRDAYEIEICDLGKWVAPVIAIGDKMSTMGAAKYISNEASWKADFNMLSSNAKLIYILLAPTNAVIWEVSQILSEPGLREKTVFVLPSSKETGFQTYSSSHWEMLYAEFLRHGIALPRDREQTLFLSVSSGDLGVFSDIVSATEVVSANIPDFEADIDVGVRHLMRWDGFLQAMFETWRAFSTMTRVSLAAGLSSLLTLTIAYGLAPVADRFEDAKSAAARNWAACSKSVKQEIRNGALVETPISENESIAACDQAIAQLQGTTKANEKRQMLLLMKGIRMLRDSRFAEALEFCKQPNNLIRVSDWSFAAACRGYAYLGLARDKEALEEFSKSLMVFDKEGIDIESLKRASRASPLKALYLGRGFVLLRLEKAREAKQDIDRGVSLSASGSVFEPFDHYDSLVERIHAERRAK